MSAHARLGPSNHRWPHCPGSVREEESYPDIPGDAAIDGTGSHLLLEMCLENNVAAAVYDQQIIGANHPEHPGGWLVGLERIERVQMCLDYIARRVAELKAQFDGCHISVAVETQADPGGAFGRDDWWGTVDITITARHPMTGAVYFIEVVDYKDGRGWVHVPGNTQLISYLFGKLRPHVGSGPDCVRPFNARAVGGCRMTIVQPKTAPVVRYVCSTRAEDNFNVQLVIDEAEKMARAAHATDAVDAPLVPGKHCQWCKANPKRGGHCTADTEKGLETVQKMSTEIITTDGQSPFEYIAKAVADPKALAVGQLAELADARDAVMAAFDKVYQEIEARIDQGEEVPGYAMQPGRGSNVWSESEEKIVKMLKARRLKKEDIFPPKLISPAQVLKLDSLTDDQKKKIEKDYITYQAGKMTLKKVSRKKVTPSLFDGVVQNETPELQSAKMMFGDVVEPKQPETEVSFF